MDYAELIEHILEHSIADTLYLIPFLFVTYVLMEWLEHRTGARTQNLIRRAGVAGPAIGAVLGVVPQCGFSAAAATLYAGRVITLGTLYAVFLSTSDEMLPIFLAENVPLSTIAAIMATKVACGMVFGFLIDLAIRLTNRREERFRIHQLCHDANCGCEGDCEKCKECPESVYEHLDEVRESESDAQHLEEVTSTHEHPVTEVARVHDDHAVDIEHSDDHDGTHDDHDLAHDHERADSHDRALEHTHDHVHSWGHILKSALIHTLKITLFIFIITIAINTVIETMGEETLAATLGGDNIGSIMLSALVGLIPNCAASIVIAQLYIEGVLGAGAMMAGLLVSAGIGLLVLIRTNRDWRQNTLIIVGLYIMGAIVGIIIGTAHITF